MTLRIDQPIDPLRRGDGEAHRHQLAGRRRQPMLRRLAMQMRAIGVRNDQAGLLRSDITSAFDPVRKRGALLGVAPTNVLVRKAERHEDTIRVENIVAEWPGADKSEARVKGASRSKSIH